MASSTVLSAWRTRSLGCADHHARLIGQESGLDIHTKGNAPADQLAAEVVRRALARRAVVAAPACQAALVRQEPDIAGIRGRIAITMVTLVVAVDPVLAGALRRWGRRPEDGGGELARYVHVDFSGASGGRAESSACRQPRSYPSCKPVNSRGRASISDLTP